MVHEAKKIYLEIKEILDGFSNDKTPAIKKFVTEFIEAILFRVSILRQSIGRVFLHALLRGARLVNKAF